MATAGRILILPKGAYDASVTYEMLDLVKYNGVSWLAKKTCVGIEPSEDNDEYWHKMFDVIETDAETKAHIGDTTIHITSEERSKWDAKVDATGTVASATNATNSDTVDGYHVAVVTELPASPDATTLYFIKE